MPDDRAGLVLVMAAKMNVELELNRHKGGWTHMKPSWLLRRLETEVRELRREVKRRATPDVIWSEAADVANFAAMIAETMEVRYAIERERERRHLMVVMTNPRRGLR